MSEAQDLGQRVARLKWADGLTWSQIEAQLGQGRVKFRSQARAGKALLTLILGPLADVSEESRERVAFAMHALAYEIEHNPEHY